MIDINKIVKKQRAVYSQKHAPNVLIYDIETTLLKVYLFGLGKQRVGHKQLVPGHSRYGIICINYCWLRDGKVQTIAWNPKTGLKGVISEFDKIIKQADLVVGKNSDRFDNKMINAARMLEGLPGLPEWTRYTDDLEKQMRKHFRLPSQSLDYISNQLNLGGKVKMEFDDWVKISQYMMLLSARLEISDKNTLGVFTKLLYNKNYAKTLKEGKQAFDKMCYYGCKDVTDTETLWLVLSEHFEPKFHFGTYARGVKNIKPDALLCKQCGSDKLVPRSGIRIRVSNKTRFREYFCKKCNKYAGRISINDLGDNRGKIG